MALLRDELLDRGVDRGGRRDPGWHKRPQQPDPDPLARAVLPWERLYDLRRRSGVDGLVDGVEAAVEVAEVLAADGPDDADLDLVLVPEHGPLAKHRSKCTAVAAALKLVYVLSRCPRGTVMTTAYPSRNHSHRCTLTITSSLLPRVRARNR